ncbi:enoyl-CoA hydratase/isomerase family protein [Shewanella sp. VB17]|uniref:enoyl-CoA hydratase-related protein n=1 Tax=Shewanella sp. VB17 TaxID=2739432 RepID=UPI0015647787|nr:enoyl-CoA hydratase-related protein [Shewanella sp. VB17]NRD74504.1 enoyl-CoA hydratase/isomerase family protein [Shewanella sp. VB17]
MSQIQVQDKQGVKIITINRPEKRNALSLEMYTCMTEHLIEGESDNAIYAFLIKGQSNVFTAGNDVADFLTASHLDEQHPAFRFLFTLLDLTKPIVAAVTGAAIGIGTTLLLHCDLVYASRSAKFQLPFINLSLVPEAGSSLLLPQLMGLQQASELLLLGESFDVQKAKSLNIINDVISDEDIFEHALAKAIKLASQPPQALQATRVLLRPNKELVRQQMKMELNEFGIRLKSDEAKIRFQAFLNNSNIIND